MSWILSSDELREQVENPRPQPKPDRLGSGDPVPLELSGRSLGASKDKLAIVTVGLPGCGKTHLARRIARYLEFFHSACVRSFIVEDYRRQLFGVNVPASFYDYTDEEGLKNIATLRTAVLADMKAFFMTEGGEGGEEAEAGACEAGHKPVGSQVGIFDALNLTRKDRLQVFREVQPLGVRVVFIEVIMEDPDLKQAYLDDISKAMPDYRDLEETAAREDFTKRVELARNVYEPLNSLGDEGHLSWIKSTNLQTIVVNRVRSYLPGRIVQFLLSLHPKKRIIYLSRHGQSEYNAMGKVGGDSALTERGTEYARRLGEFAEKVVARDSEGKVRPARLWTSTLRRTRQTASYIKPLECEKEDGTPFQSLRPKAWTNLDEIYAGICDGMTYEEVKAKFPDEACRRCENKLSYRYPRGESYMDLVQRLEPIVHELERHEEPLLIVGHQAVLRVIYCYLMGISREEAPRVSMPLHTVVKLEPYTYMCEEERIPLILGKEGNPQDTPSH
mmetsp:Transcript_60285/g.155249  ORF Transcript_60285/g.155249 Transcript_60285/m.155249 type:complete len:503 (-) Transcript_60285:272-1780(-)